MQKLLTALIKAKQDFKSIPKDRTNPHYKTKYSTLDAVLGAVEPALHANGLTLVQVTELVGDRPILKTCLYHESGETIASVYPLPDVADPQKLGSAVTYARRYSVCALLSVTADEDDDGNGAIGKTQQADKPLLISDKQAYLLSEAATQAGYTQDGFKLMVKTAGFKARKEITIAAYDELLKAARDPEMADAWNEQSAIKAA